jgi:hypothetical protein
MQQNKTKHDKAGFEDAVTCLNTDYIAGNCQLNLSDIMPFYLDRRGMAENQDGSHFQDGGQDGGQDRVEGEPQNMQFVNLQAANNNGLSTTGRVWTVGMPARTRHSQRQTNPIFGCYIFFILLGIVCVGLGLGFMIDLIDKEDISNIGGPFILVVLGICLQLYAIFDIFKYVKAERQYQLQQQQQQHQDDHVLTHVQNLEVVTESGTSVGENYSHEIVAIVETNSNNVFNFLFFSDL